MKLAFAVIVISTGLAAAAPSARADGGKPADTSSNSAGVSTVQASGPAQGAQIEVNDARDARAGVESVESVDIDKPEVEGPEIEKPEIDRPDVERPETGRN